MRGARSQRVANYLEKYAILPLHPELPQHWHRVMVVPCFRESIHFTQRLPKRADDPRLLVICVLNRPGSDPNTDANTPLRQFLERHTKQKISDGLRLCRVADSADILLLDLELIEGPTPEQQGVGRARRVGCDLALWLMDTGRITSRWILSSDADAKWPEHFISHRWPEDAVAFTLPFEHDVDLKTELGRATLIYEIWLHAYVRGLEEANSPYAFHTLGSCCGFHADAYAAVRGVPLRAGAEDFYLLNKLCKLGQLYRPPGPPVVIEARTSTRVPFGTGPAVQRLLQHEDPLTTNFFYHPDCFRALKAVLGQLPIWLENPTHDLQVVLGRQLGPELSVVITKVLADMGLSAAIGHARRQGATPAARQQHLSVWFDGFRTLKFIHALRRSARPDISYLEAWQDSPLCTDPRDPGTLRRAMAAHWGWSLRQDNLGQDNNDAPAIPVL